MAELNDLPKTKAVEHYPKEGPLKSVKIVFEGYWGRFEKTLDSQRVALRGKGEVLNSRAFNVSIPSVIYQKMYKRALAEFGIVKRKVAANPVKQEEEPAHRRELREEAGIVLFFSEKFAIVPVVPIHHPVCPMQVPIPFR